MKNRKLEKTNKKQNKNKNKNQKTKKPKNLQVQMQRSFSLNNLGVRLKVSNPGDGASDIVL
jgi:hypothetical protein